MLWLEAERVSHTPRSCFIWSNEGGYETVVRSSKYVEMDVPNKWMYTSEMGKLHEFKRQPQCEPFDFCTDLTWLVSDWVF